MSRALLPLLILVAGAAPPPDESPFGAPAVSEAELADMSGGFSLPGGLDLSIVVRTETSVDGTLLLRSVYALDNGAPTVQLFAPAPGQTLATDRESADMSISAGSAGVQVIFDRQNGVSFVTSGPDPMTGIAVTTGPVAETMDDGLNPLPIGPGGSIQTAGGRVTLDELSAGARARIEGDKIDVSHLVGGAFGSIIANSGSDRAIDTMTTVSLDLRGATPENLGSALPRVEAIVLDSVRQLVR